jgi:hypothetical protein
MDTVELARYLIGKVAVHDTDDGRLSGRIVATEAYPVGNSAGHAFRGESGRESSCGPFMVTTLLARRAQVHQTLPSRHTTPFDPSLQNQVLSLRLVHSGASVADAPKLAYGLLDVL